MQKPIQLQMPGRPAGPQAETPPPAGPGILFAAPHRPMFLAGAAQTVLAFLPWIDTSKVKSMSYRPIGRQLFWAFVVVCIGLGYLGAMPAEGGYVIASQIFTVLYFGFFVALFVVGLFERPKALPTSIADAVLASANGGSAARVATATAAEPNVKG